MVPPAAAYTAKWRTVYDLKAINTATVKLPMAYGSQAEALAKVQPGDVLAVLDVKDGFTAVPVNVDARVPFVFVTHGQGVMEAARMPFGYKLAPFFFCLFSGAVAQAVQVSLGGTAARVHMYMDDLLIALRPTRFGLGGAQAQVDGARALMEACGAMVSSKKIEGPAHSVTYLCLTVDTASPCVRVWMPEAKWFTLRELLALRRWAVLHCACAGVGCAP